MPEIFTRLSTGSQGASNLTQGRPIHTVWATTHQTSEELQPMLTWQTGSFEDDDVNDCDGGGVIIIIIIIKLILSSENWQPGRDWQGASLQSGVESFTLAVYI